MCGVVHVFFMGKCELGELEALQPGNEKTQKNKNKIYKLTRWTAEARRRTGTVAGRRWVYHSAWRDDDELIIMRGRQQERGNHGPSPARSVRRLHRRIPRRRRPLQAPASSSYVLVVVCIVLTHSLTHTLTHSPRQPRFCSRLPPVWPAAALPPHPPHHHPSVLSYALLSFLLSQ